MIKEHKYISLVLHSFWCESDISVSVVSDYGLDDQGSIPDRGIGFFLARASRLVLGPTQLPVQ
jgi:hypothetical protein